MLLIRDLSHQNKQQQQKKNHWLIIKEWKKVFQKNGPFKQAGVALLIYDKVPFRLKSVRKDNEDNFILIKGTIHQEEISVLNIYIPNIGALNYITNIKKN
jgi:hypothetical protein